MDSVEASNQASSDAILHDYEDKNISLIRLLKSLLATATMPHIVLIVVTSSVLYILAGIDTFTVFSSLAFTSLTVAYAVTALLSNNKVVKKMISLDQNSSEGEQSFVVSNIIKFKICLFPLAIALVVFLLINTIAGENGMLPGVSNLIPTALGMLFILWSIIQGSSFTQWASSVSARNFQQATKPRTLRTSFVVTVMAIITAGLALSTLFYQFNDLERSVTQSLVASIPFLALATAVTAASLAYSWKLKILSSMKPSLHRFSHKWSIICHLFITWHLLTIWRQNFLDPSSFQVFIEEIVLMIFTVFFAIWSMTSKSYKSSFRLISEENALTWGLSFGYAYAGSVAMLTSFFDDIKTVMLVGHCLVVVTVIIMHKLILSKVIGTDDYSVEISRITQTDNEVEVSGEENDLVETHQDKSSVEKGDSDAWQEDDDVDWEAKRSGPEIDGLEWDETIDID